MASEMPRRAAGIYDESHTLADTDTQAREFAFLTLKASQAAGDNKLALDYFCNYQQRFPADPELLDEAISICQAGDDPKQAYEMVISGVCHSSPYDPGANQQAVNCSLAVGELYSLWF